MFESQVDENGETISDMFPVASSEASSVKTYEDRTSVQRSVATSSQSQAELRNSHDSWPSTRITLPLPQSFTERSSKHDYTSSGPFADPLEQDYPISVLLARSGRDSK
jgi:hypothetical protein